MDTEVKRCTIDTVNITIQALYVDKKQMTLAVFRQLPKVDVPSTCLEEVIQFVWWGYVNYQMKSYDYSKWLVFSFKDKLFRCSPIHEETRNYFISDREFYEKKILTSANAEYVEKAKEMIQLYNEREKLYNDIVKITYSLPQLFIAV